MTAEHSRPRPIVDDLDVSAALDALDMTEADLDANLEVDGDLGLGGFFDPPDGFVERVTKRAEGRLAKRQALEAIVDLAALPWLTLRTLIDDESDHDA